MKLEDRIFTRARLGRHWTPAAATACLAFFPLFYRFDRATELRFQSAHRHDYSGNLRHMMAAATEPQPA